MFDGDLPAFDPKMLEEVDRDPVQRESDRGCVLLLAADVENCLTDLLKTWIAEVADLPASESRRLFSISGILGTFGAKIALCRAMGLIPDVLSRDLIVLKKIRNHAAHSNAAFSLSEPGIRELVASMALEHQKKEPMKRWSLLHQNDEPLPQLKGEHEAIMKGRGLLRFDKSNFHLTALNLQGEIKLATLSAKYVGAQTREFLESIRKRSTCDPNCD